VQNTDAVVTFAIGKDYFKYALSLADSFLLFNSKNKIEFFIITDTEIHSIKKLNHKVKIITSNTLLHGEDVLLNKFKVRDYVKSKNILLIDADSFICCNLSPIFSQHLNNDVVIWGSLLSKKDDWRGNSIDKLKSLTPEKLYKINGGVYLFKDTLLTERFFHQCTKLLSDYDDHGFAKVYGNYKDDEVVFSTALVLMDMQAYLPNSDIKVETMYFTRRYINLFFGNSRFYNSNFDRDFVKNIEAKNPMIICFDRVSVNDFDYKLTSNALQYGQNNYILRIFFAVLTTLILNSYYMLKYFKWNLANLKNIN